jgi:hypothetical protein
MMHRTTATCQPITHCIVQRGSTFGVGALALTDALLVASAIGAADAVVLFYKLPPHDAPFALGRPFCNVADR